MYSNVVLEIFNNPKNAGRISKPDGIADNFNEDRTAHVEFSLRVDSGIIVDCKFRAQANPYIIAICSTMANMVTGKMISMLFLDQQNIKENLGDNSDIDITFCIDCMKMAIQDYIEKFEKANKKKNEEVVESLPETKKSKYKKLLLYFKDIDELEKVRLYDLNPLNLENEVSKKMINIAFMNWNLFETLFSYLLAETFAESRVEDILTHEKILEQEQEKKKAFALIRIEDKSTLLSKAIKIFDKLRGGSKEESNSEENSAAAAKARLSKVMIGRQIAKEELEKENNENNTAIKNVGNVIQTARSIENLPQNNQTNGI